MPPEAKSGPLETSKMKSFSKIVNAKLSILDVWVGPEKTSSN